MLRMKPNAKSNYKIAEFLQAGGVAGTTAGLYVASTDSRILRRRLRRHSVEEVERTVPLNAARWYGSGITLPDGKVFTVSGADRDVVVAPGTGFPVTSAELFDPKTKSWTQVAEQNNPRTYHNSALLGARRPPCSSAATPPSRLPMARTARCQLASARTTAATRRSRSTNLLTCRTPGHHSSTIHAAPWQDLHGHHRRPHQASPRWSSRGTRRRPTWWTQTSE